jgi:alpha-amylase/alpha-mannosidase (GH57 family)
MERYVCIHAHFYQPPRENPWLEEVELQDSAYPYHDWNERITAESYAPNAASRVMDGNGRIVNIVNNYAKISFNFGPTLLSWMQDKEPAVYRAILDADRESREHFSGHGSAIAQAHNHMILPLANGRDKRTQVLWGIRDFEHRFGREPEGMWLPETAVDLESLDIMAREGIRYAILEPHQAHRVRKRGSREWQDVTGGRIDPKAPYRLRLPSGRTIAVFFYDGPVSRAVAFEGLLNNGEVFANRILGAFPEGRGGRYQLVHIATDGESYGHHHAHGEMALSYAIHHIESNGLARVTNYGEFLEKHPPAHEVEIYEYTSWSCAHGVERWRSNCGCNSGGRPGWNQEWRRPLREALDWLRETLASEYEGRGRSLLRDPWSARDEYIGILLDRSPESRDRFFREHAVRNLSAGEETTALKLLELQRHAMLMYTSCGWFFDELSGIETTQVLQYAGRAVQLARELWEDGIEERFLSLLESAGSNLPEHRDGRHIYEKFVKPAMVDLHKVGAHYAVSSLFESYDDQANIFCYQVDREEYRLLPAGKKRLALGRARITSEITRESADVTFGVLHFGDHNVSGGIREFRGQESYESLAAEMSEIFAGADFPEIIRAVDRNFGAGVYSLKLLFRDEQRKILDMILAATMTDIDGVYRQLYMQNASLMRFLSDIGYPASKSFHAAAELALNGELKRAFQAETLDIDAIRGTLYEAEGVKISLDGAGLGYTLRKSIERMMHAFRENPDDIVLLAQIDAAVEMGNSLPFEVTFWKTQNLYWEMLETVLTEYRSRAALGDEVAGEWVRLFSSLGSKLSVALPEG